MANNIDRTFDLKHGVRINRGTYLLSGDANPWTEFSGQTVSQGSLYLKSDGTWFYKFGAGQVQADWKEILNVHTIDELIDVEAPTPSDTQVLSYVQANSRWEPADVSGWDKAATDLSAPDSATTTIDSTISTTTQKAVAYFVVVENGTARQSCRVEALSLVTGTVDYNVFGFLGESITFDIEVVETSGNFDVRIINNSGGNVTVNAYRQEF